MAKDTMSKTSKVAKAGPPGVVAKGGKAPLPVARTASKEEQDGLPGDGKGGKAPPPLYTNFGKALADLPEMARTVRELNRRIKELKEEADTYNHAIRDLMGTVDDEKSWSVRDIDDTWVALYIKPKDRETLVKELLIQQGVTLKQIQKATKITPSKPYASVRDRNEKFEGRQDED